LSAAQQHLTDLGPRAIQARITSVARYEAGHASIVLDNDQSWVVNEDDGRLSPGDRVTIKRAAMGSFMLLSPANHTYHARRVR
jgi:protein involved in polysaccharide export with SLBB domain